MFSSHRILSTLNSDCLQHMEGQHRYGLLSMKKKQMGALSKKTNQTRSDIGSKKKVRVKKFDIVQSKLAWNKVCN